MARILTILSLSLALILFPPAALALVSNNAVPGDATYGVKRKLEDGIILVASLTPTTRAWFSVELTGRRFKEAAVLITKNEQASTTLTELVDQTSTAALEVSQISDPVKRTELIEQLSQSITTYNEGLSAAAGLPAQNVVVEEPVPTPTPSPTATPGPAFSRSTPAQQGQTPLTPKPTPVQPTFKPTGTIPPAPTPQATPTVTVPTPIAAPQPISSNDNEINSSSSKKEQVDQTRKELDKIKKRLEEEKEKIKEQRQNETQKQKEQTSEQKQETNQENTKLTPVNTSDKIKQ